MTDFLLLSASSNINPYVDGVFLGRKSPKHLISVLVDAKFGTRYSDMMVRAVIITTHV